MNTILTLKYGTKYTAKDVNRIYDSTNGAYHYLCVTDDAAGLHPDINTLPLDPANIDGHWEKIKLLQLTGYGKILYLDLDIVIQNNIENLFKVLDKNPVICYTYWKKKNFTEHKDHRWSYNYLSNYNSSVMLWEDARNIYEYWMKNQDYYMVKYAGDDRFLFHEKFKFDFFPENEIYSFKFSGSSYRPEYTIALLNGQADFPELVKEYDALRMYQMG